MKLELEINDKDYKTLSNDGFCSSDEINGFLHEKAEHTRSLDRAKRTARKNPKIENIEAVYTGGGVWIFYGKCTKPGEWFMIDNDGEFVEIYDANPENFDESLYEEWEEAHRVRTIYENKRELKAFLTEALEKANFCDKDYYYGWWEVRK